jgi:hypothetical protein
MVRKCPKCGRNVPDDSVYCAYCGYGMQSSARTTQVSSGATLIIVATVASLIHFILSIKALANIYLWYPPTVAEGWVPYDKMLLALSFTGFLGGISAGALSLARKRYRWTMASAVLCTLSGAGAWITSIIIPFADWGYSTFYFFLPMFVPAIIGTLLIYPRMVEFKQ